MTSTLQLETERLYLRPLEERDRIPFAEMNADPDVMRFFYRPFTRQESDEAISRYQAQHARDGFSFHAAQDRHTGEFLGIIGMQTMRIAIPNLPQPAVEIGWRLTTAAQGRGFATEGARAFLDHAFQNLHLPSVVAITTPANTSSRRVMEKLGMLHLPGLTFLHPHVPQGHPFQQHVVYQILNPRETPCSV